MEIAERIFWISGIPYGMNANVFAIQTEKGTVLIDTGSSDEQLDNIKKEINKSGLDPKIEAAFLTHAHMDHAGNARRIQSMGAKLIAGEDEADVLENGGSSVLEELFGDTFLTCKSVYRAKDREIFSFGDTKIEALAFPGHTTGNMAYLATVDGKKILFAGDIFLIAGATPLNQLIPEIGWEGGPDFDKEKNLDSFCRLTNFDVDIIAPGHGCVYYGDSRKLFDQLYTMAKEKYLKELMTK